MEAITKFFLSIPFELQEKIISQRDDLILIFSQVNSFYRCLLEREYYCKFFNKCVSDKEWASVYNNQPFTITIYSKKNNEKCSYLLRVARRCLALNIHFLEIKQFDTKIKVYETKFHPDLSPDYLNSVIYEYMWGYNMTTSDTLTYFNVNNNRTRCVEIDPNFAKNRCLDDLNDEMERYDVIKTCYYENNVQYDERIDEEYKSIVIYTYVRLIVDKYVFNIIDNSDLYKLEDVEQNLEDIENDIDYLFNTIRNKILNM